MREPLVDTVDLKAVATNPCEVITFDLLKVKKSDLAFTAPFRLGVTRKDCPSGGAPGPADRADVHALLAWFDVSFSACHKPVSFSTGPHAKYTHWKQTVFYTGEALAVDGVSSLLRRHG